MSMHDYVFDRCEDIHRSGALVLRLETEELAGALVQVEASLGFGRAWEGLLEVWELLEERPDGEVHAERRIASGPVTFREVLDEAYALIADIGSISACQEAVDWRLLNSGLVEERPA